MTIRDLCLRPRAPGVGLLIAVTALLSGGCDGNPSAPSAPLNQPIVIKVGETVRVDAARMDVRFDRVTSDSRCPGDAVCITAGDAVVAVTVTSLPGSAMRYELHTADPSEVRHRSFTLALEQLSPYPFSSLPPIDPAAYEATIRVTK